MAEEKPVPVSMNSILNSNITTLLAIGGVAVTVITGWNKLDSRIEAVEQFRTQRVQMTDQNFAAINAQLAVLQNLPYRMTQAETRLDENGKRMDRFSETFLGTLDGMRKDIASLSTKVEVLSGKIDTITPKKAAWTAPSEN